MDVTLGNSVPERVTSLVQLRKAEFPMDVAAGKLTELRPVQP